MSYLDKQPIIEWKIAEDVEHIFLGTIERRERWERILAKNQPLQVAAVPNLKPFKIHLN